MSWCLISFSFSLSSFTSKPLFIGFLYCFSFLNFWWNVCFQIVFFFTYSSFPLFRRHFVSTSISPLAFFLVLEIVLLILSCLILPTCVLSFFFSPVASSCLVLVRWLCCICSVMKVPLHNTMYFLCTALIALFINSWSSCFTLLSYASLWFACCIYLLSFLCNGHSLCFSKICIGNEFVAVFHDAPHFFRLVLLCSFLWLAKYLYLSMF